MAKANPFPVGSTRVLSYLVEQDLSSHCDRVTMVGVPNLGNTRNFLGICVQDRAAILKINVQASVSLSYLPVSSLQNLEQRELGWRKSQLVASFYLHQCDQDLCIWSIDVNVCISPSLYIKLFTLGLARRLWKTFPRL